MIVRMLIFPVLVFLVAIPFLRADEAVAPTLFRPAPVAEGHGRGLHCLVDGFALASDEEEGQVCRLEIHGDPREPDEGRQGESMEGRRQEAMEGSLLLGKDRYALEVLRWQGGQGDCPLRHFQAVLHAAETLPTPSSFRKTRPPRARKSTPLGRLKARIVLKSDGPGGRRTAWALDGRLRLNGRLWRIAGRARLRFEGRPCPPPPARR